MSSSLQPRRQEDVWEALSEVFNDNDVDYGFIAEQLGDVEPMQLKAIFFSEVAPQCAFNVFAVIPPVWTGFDRDSLASCIRDMKARNRGSRWARIRHGIAVAFYRLCFRSDWERIEAELDARSGRPAA